MNTILVDELNTVITLVNILQDILPDVSHQLFTILVVSWASLDDARNFGLAPLVDPSGVSSEKWTFKNDRVGVGSGRVGRCGLKMFAITAIIIRVCAKWSSVVVFSCFTSFKVDEALYVGGVMWLA